MILIVKLIANLLLSIASRTISGHQKLLVCWVHSSWEVFSAILKLSVRARSITTVHLARNSHMNAVWRSHKHAMLLLTGETLSASQKPSLILPHSVSDCCIDGFQSLECSLMYSARDSVVSHLLCPNSLTHDFWTD